MLELINAHAGKEYFAHAGKDILLTQEKEWHSRGKKSIAHAEKRISLTWEKKMLTCRTMCCSGIWGPAPIESWHLFLSCFAGCLGQVPVTPKSAEHGVRGAADKAANPMGCKSPTVNYPIQTVSISGPNEGNLSWPARMEKPRLPNVATHCGRNNLGGEQTFGPEH